ncbi:MAG: C39 family peptidase, partial [Oscillospiraceae bacterium]|nr:C39 family peptidase [Oscillospiraceae bacterium]
MIEIKTKAAAFLFIFILALLSFACACSGGGNDTPPHEKISFSDENGISFSLQATPCSDGKSNGKINLSIDGESTYLYSTDFGRSFHRARNSEASFNRLAEDSYSFCFMERDMPDTITDIYTIYADSLLRPYPITATAVSSAENFLSDGEITVRIENFTDGTKYEATIDGWETSKDLSGETVSFSSLGEGVYYITVRDKNNPEDVSPTLRVPVVHSDIGTSAYIEVTPVMQIPELPTGCEVTSLTMLLNYIGFDVDKLTLADEYLPKGEYRKTDFNKVFVGDPRNRNAYGCTAAVIAETAEKFLNVYDTENKWQVVNITGYSPEMLYSAVKSGNPVVVWGSINMGDIIEDYVTWTDEETGNTISWVGGEHCLLLTGYDTKESLVYVNDPLRGQVSYDMRTFE